MLASSAKRWNHTPPRAPRRTTLQEAGDIPHKLVELWLRFLAFYGFQPTELSFHLCVCVPPPVVVDARSTNPMVFKVSNKLKAAHNILVAWMSAICFTNSCNCIICFHLHKPRCDCSTVSCRRAQDNNFSTPEKRTVCWAGLTKIYSHQF